MRRKLCQFGLCTLVFGVILGCNRQMVQQKQPPDPLLVSKAAVEGRYQAKRADSSARVEPPPPYPGGDSATTPVQRASATVRPEWQNTSYPRP